MRKSVLVSVAILALVFGFYLLTGLGCKENTDTEPRDKGEGAEPKVKHEASKELADASKKGKDFLVGLYGKKMEEGGWGKTYIGIDAFACLGLMSEPNSMKPTEKPLDEMITFFLEKQNKDKGFWASLQRGQPVYETSLVLLTLKTAITVDPKHPKKKEIEDAIKKAVDYLILAQVDETPIDENDVVVKADEEGFNRAHYGGWGYGFNRPGKAPANLSTSHFAMDALYESGLKDDPKVKAAFKKALGFLENCQNSGEKEIIIPKGTDKFETDMKIKYGNDGGALYGPGIAKPKNIVKEGYEVVKSYGSMTYVLMKEYVFAGLEKTDPKVQAAFNWLKKAENFTFEKNPGYDDMPYAGLFYQLYAASKALGIMGEEIIKDSKGEEHNWRAEMQKYIMSIQKEDGSWMNEHESRWMEGNPILASAYALAAIGNTLK